MTLDEDLRHARERATAGDKGFEMQLNIAIRQAAEQGRDISSTVEEIRTIGYTKLTRYTLYRAQVRAEDGESMKRVEEKLTEAKSYGLRVEIDTSKKAAEIRAMVPEPEWYPCP